MNQSSEENLDLMEQACLKPKKKKGRVLIALLIILLVFMSVFFILCYMDILPFFGLDIIEPPGDAKTVDADILMQELPSIANMPNLEKLDYKAFDTNAPVEEIVEEYNSKLISEGYSQKYVGTVEIDGINFEVSGYLKGLTAVGILTTDEEVKNCDYDSLVLYATGNALDFQEILSWYESN